MEYVALSLVLAAVTTAVIRLRRRPRRARARIAGLGPGWVEVRGRARGGPARTRAPISGRVGLGWRVLVEFEAGIRGWEAVLDHSECVDFELEDDSGRIRVRASNSTVSLEVGEQRGRGGPFAPPPAAVEQLLAAQVEIHGVLFHKGVRWREWVLEEGREVRVRGHVVREPGDVAIGYRRLAAELVLAGGSTRPLLVDE